VTVEQAADATVGATDIGELEEEVIAQCRFTPEQVAHLVRERQRGKLSFVEAAVQLGFITQSELISALEAAREIITRRDPGVVERMVRRSKKATMAVTKKPPILVKASTELILAHDQDNPRSERIRALRTELMLLNQVGTLATPLALLSPGASEGRSQLTAELAIAFSQLGQRTLLVDADLRRPRQHVLFHAQNDWGLAQVLGAGGAATPFGVEGLPQLSLMTSGRTVPNPLELLSDGRFERLLMSWRSNYEFILIDTPPVSDFADGLLIASLATQVLALSRANKTAHDAMREMLRRLAATQSRILGAVISHF
jgi:protein-tyrosine kinase